MKGRLEHDLKNEERIRTILFRMPEFVTEWDTNMQACGKTATTRIGYLYKVELYLKYINQDTRNITLNDLTLSSVQDFLISMQHIMKKGELCESSDSYKELLWNAMNSLFLYMTKCEYFSKNPMDMIECPKNNDRERIRMNRRLLDSEEFREILKAVDNDKECIMRHRNKAIILIFMTTGIRRTALTEINIEDIDEISHTLTVIDKRKKTHIYYLGESTVEALRKWQEERPKYLKDEENSALFLNNRGSRIGVCAVNDIATKYTKAALKERLTAHKFRAGYINVLYRKIHDLDFVRKAVGHSSVLTTARYIDAEGDERKKARDLMEMAIS